MAKDIRGATGEWVMKPCRDEAATREVENVRNNRPELLNSE